MFDHKEVPTFCSIFCFDLCSIISANLNDLRAFLQNLDQFQKKKQKSRQFKIPWKHEV